MRSEVIYCAGDIWTNAKECKENEIKIESHACKYSKNYSFLSIQQMDTISSKIYTCVTKQ
jgi:hypothetical protein